MIAVKTKSYPGTTDIDSQVLFKSRRRKNILRWIPHLLNIQLHQIGRPLIRLIEIQMIFKFCAYIKLREYTDGYRNENRDYKTNKEENNVSDRTEVNLYSENSD